jgi:N-acetylneuraminic acid mutarotase
VRSGRRLAVDRWAVLGAIVAFVTVGLPTSAVALPGTWQTKASPPAVRSEASYVALGDNKIHLVGGKKLVHHMYDPATNSWSSKAQMPEKVDHTQGVEVGGKLYFVGGLASWPGPHVSTVRIYDPATNAWSLGASMGTRGRGAGGVAVHQGKIYYAGGLHDGVAVKWFDVYDPATDTWSELPDMPREREHFHAAVVGGTFYAFGGRKVDINAFVTQSDAYDISSGAWQTGLEPIPTPRGGFGATAVGDQIVVFGGEGGGEAKDEVEAYDTANDCWYDLTPMPTGLHGIQAAQHDGTVYIATGSDGQGGGNATAIHQAFTPGSLPGCDGGGGGGGGGDPVPVGFGKSTLSRTNSGLAFNQPTTLQFGPDGRLYVGLINGTIKVYTVQRNAANSYSATQVQEILAVKNIQNHDDDGAPNSTCPALCKRLMTGILVTGTAANPVIYATSSDPRIGGGAEGSDLNLDTNSGTLSRLTWNGSSWQHTILVQGLPRSEENHTGNGMALNTTSNTLYLAQGGNTNKGARSNNFALLPEYALSAAILSVDLGAIGSSTYSIPTLDDEDRAGTNDANDPFGGNNGKNQAKLVAGGPVKVHAPGFRNPYDVVITQNGNMYTVDNGPNAGWGDIPINEGTGGNCTNGVNEPGTSNPDVLHLVTSGYYGGHPNPTRGNDSNTFNSSNPQSPVPSENGIECDFQHFNSGGPGLTTLSASSNGIDEYTTNNFDGAMNGDLIVTGFVANEVQRVELNSAGTSVVSKEDLFSNVGTHPLDVTIMGGSEAFPGTIWVADIATDQVYVFEPNDFGGGGGGGGGCTGADDPGLDEDGDGYDNADEIDNGTNPCSAADVPPDADGDFTSDRNDPDDDNDGIPDTSDPFAVDPANGTTTQIPVEYSWENDAPNPGGLLNTGFTGLMTNGVADYLTRFDPDNMTIGGAAGVITVDEVPAGDSFKLKTSQKYAFQFGVMPSSTQEFTVQSRIVGPFSGLTAQASQSMGLFVGDGDMSDYVKVVTRGNKGGQVQMVKELGDSVSANRKKALPMPGPDYVDLFLTISPSSGTIRGSYEETTGGVTGARIYLGTPIGIPQRWYDGSQGLAVGMISTSTGPGPEFPATWDFMRVDPGS